MTLAEWTEPGQEGYLQDMATRPTLAQLNEGLSDTTRGDHHGYTTTMHYAVGRSGHRNSGSHSHLVKVQLIVAELGEHKPGTLKIGDALGTYSPCNTNGQHIAREIKGYDTDVISCTKCIKVLDRMAELIQKETTDVTTATKSRKLTVAQKAQIERDETAQAEAEAKLAESSNGQVEAEAETPVKAKRLTKAQKQAAETARVYAEETARALAAQAKAAESKPTTVTIGGVVKVLWSAEERAELKALIAKSGYSAGCKAFVEANPTRTVQGAQYQAQNALKRA